VKKKRSEKEQNKKEKEKERSEEGKKKLRKSYVCTYRYHFAQGQIFIVVSRVSYRVFRVHS
jgi:hypothetical protein